VNNFTFIKNIDHLFLIQTVLLLLGGSVWHPLMLSGVGFQEYGRIDLKE